MEIAATALLLLLGVGQDFSSGLEVSAYSIDGGGGLSTSADFALRGTIGQMDAQISAGGGFELTGGFWSSTSSVVFADGFESGSTSRWTRTVQADPLGIWEEEE